MLRSTTCSVDQQILQHMIDTQAEFIMEVTDKTKADVKVIYLLLVASLQIYQIAAPRVVLLSTTMAKCACLRLHRFLRNTSRNSSRVGPMLLLTSDYQ
jgi:UTP--glucose-1-phosphate uridylyltransferase